MRSHACSSSSPPPPSSSSSSTSSSSSWRQWTVTQGGWAGSLSQPLLSWTDASRLPIASQLYNSFQLCQPPSLFGITQFFTLFNSMSYELQPPGIQALYTIVYSLTLCPVNNNPQAWSCTQFYVWQPLVLFVQFTILHNNILPWLSSCMYNSLPPK